jgi:CRISP-associated protein Cas1
MKDLHVLPKVRDSLSYLYVEHCRIDQEDKAIALHDKNGKTPVPCAALVMLMLGPGTSITHAAIRALADNGCLVVWSGEENVRFYAQGLGETRSARNLLRQARLCSNPDRRLQVVLRMYQHRFDEPLGDGKTLRQIRGREGIRVREAYARASRATGVPWGGCSNASCPTSSGCWPWTKGRQAMRWTLTPMPPYRVLYGTPRPAVYRVASTRPTCNREPHRHGGHHS